MTLVFHHALTSLLSKIHRSIILTIFISALTACQIENRVPTLDATETPRPTLSIPVNSFITVDSKFERTMIPGTEDDQIAEIVVFCAGVSTTYSADSPEFWSIVQSTYRALEDGWTMPWELYDSWKQGGVRPSKIVEDARKNGMGIELIYSQPLRPIDSFLLEMLKDNTTRLFYEIDPREPRGIVFPGVNDRYISFYSFEISQEKLLNVLGRVCL